jgi:hypothetical protein
MTPSPPSSSSRTVPARSAGVAVTFDFLARPLAGRSTWRPSPPPCRLRPRLPRELPPRRPIGTRGSRDRGKSETGSQSLGLSRTDRQSSRPRSCRTRLRTRRRTARCLQRPGLERTFARRFRSARARATVCSPQAWSARSSWSRSRVTRARGGREYVHLEPQCSLVARP